MPDILITEVDRLPNIPNLTAGVVQTYYLGKGDDPAYESAGAVLYGYGERNSANASVFYAQVELFTATGDKVLGSVFEVSFSSNHYERSYDDLLKKLLTDATSDKSD